MATLKTTILKAKPLKDGRYKVRIAVSHKGETTYINTRYAVFENQFKNGQVIKRPDASVINLQLRRMLNKYQERLDNINCLGLYTSIQLKDMVSKSFAEEESSFENVSRKFVEELIDQGRISYATSIERICRYFIEFAHGDVMLVDITPNMILNFTHFLKKRKISESTVNTLLAQTKAVINKAIKEQLVTYSIHPFIATKIAAAPVRKLDISLASFNKIRQSEFALKRLRVARDLFCLSFYLGGMNLIDIMNTDFRYSTIRYERIKTARRMQSESVTVITIQKEAREIIDRWMDKKTGKLNFGYKLAYHPFSQYVTYSIQKLAKAIDVNERISFYSARKSFAQYASDIGIPSHIIDYILGHSDKSRGVIRYYTKIRQRQADMAIAKVIDYVNNPDKYKEYIDLRSDLLMMQI